MARDTSIAASQLFFTGVAPERLEPQFQRYTKRVRKSLRRLAKSSPRFGDLIFAFPAAAFALAVERGPVAERQAAVRLVKAGAPLQAIADALRLPWWTRRLPPEAFARPFDEVFDDEDAARRLVGAAPGADRPEALAAWFEWVNAAAGFAAPDFVYWMARRERVFSSIYGGPPEARPEPTRHFPALAAIAAFAFASRVRAGVASEAVDRAWSLKMSFGGAARATAEWLERVACACHPASTEGAAWRRTQSVAGYKFAPRFTPEELTKEGRIMRNCVGTYAQEVADGECLIFAVRRGGTPVATMEIALDANGRPFIAQLEAPDNQPAPAPIQRAANAWLSRQGPCPLRARGFGALASAEAGLWEAAFAPFFDAFPHARAAEAARLFQGPVDDAKVSAFRGTMQNLRMMQGVPA